ncbi:MAG: N-acetyltransferase [Sphingobium sp.]|nr:N-acetyltransferase [Sphingobium sp.]
MPSLHPLSSQKHDAIEELLDAAFGQDRHSRTAYIIRRGTNWIASFSYAAIDDDGAFVGLLQSWPVMLRNEETGIQTPLIMVGPVAVSPHHQGGGIGRMLMDRLVEDADLSADAPLMMIGDPEYYGRFWNFTAQATSQWSAPGPVEAHRLLSRDIACKPPLDLHLSGMLSPRQIIAADIR